MVIALQERVASSAVCMLQISWKKNAKYHQNRLQSDMPRVRALPLASNPTTSTATAVVSSCALHAPPPALDHLSISRDVVTSIRTISTRLIPDGVFSWMRMAELCAKLLPRLLPSLTLIRLHPTHKRWAETPHFASGVLMFRSTIRLLRSRISCATTLRNIACGQMACLRRKPTLTQIPKQRSMLRRCRTC